MFNLVRMKDNVIAQDSVYIYIYIYMLGYFFTPIKHDGNKFIILMRSIAGFVF